jgi:hypothetical protein
MSDQSDKTPFIISEAGRKREKQDNSGPLCCLATVLYGANYIKIQTG